MSVSGIEGMSGFTPYVPPTVPSAPPSAPSTGRAPTSRPRATSTSTARCARAGSPPRTCSPRSAMPEVATAHRSSPVANSVKSAPRSCGSTMPTTHAECLRHDLMIELSRTEMVIASLSARPAANQPELVQSLAARMAKISEALAKLPA